MQTEVAHQPHPARMRAWEWGALLVVLAVAGFLRLGSPEIVEYRRDEANLSRLALQMARGERVPLLGIGSSIGVPNPPWSAWVFVPPYLLFGNDSVRATQYVGVLGVLAVLLLFLFARRWFGPAVALIAAALFATSPWAVIWSRKLWAQDVIPFFVLLTIGLGVLGFLERKRWAQGCFLPLLAITGQIYYGTFVLIPAAVYLVWAGRKHLGRPFWIGAGVALLTAVPFAVGAIQAWNQLPPGAAAEHLASEAAERSVAPSDHVLLRLRDAWGGSGARAFLGGEVEDEALDGAPDGETFYEILGVLALAGGAWMVCRALPKGASRLDRVLALWMVVTPLVYALTWTIVWIHYMLPVLPLGFLGLGVGLRDLSKGALFRVGGPTPWIATGVVLLLAFGTVQVWSQTSILGFVGRHHTPGGFGVPLGRRLKARDDILARKPQRVLIFSRDDDVVEDGEAAIWDVLLSDRKDVTVVPHALGAHPRESAIVVNAFAVTDTDLKVHSARTERHDTQYLTPSDFSQSFFVALRSGGYAPPATHTVVEMPPFRGGVRILSYAWDEASNHLALAWRVDGPQEGSFHVEARLLNEGGTEIQRLEGRLSRGRNWRAGDTLLWSAGVPWEAPIVSCQQPFQTPLLDPHAIEVRLFTLVKRPGHEKRQWIALQDEANTAHVTLKRR